MTSCGVDSPGVVDQPCPAQPQCRHPEGRRSSPGSGRTGPRLRRTVRRPGVASQRQPVVRRRGGDARGGRGRRGRRRTPSGLYCLAASPVGSSGCHSSRIQRNRQETYASSFSPKHAFYDHRLSLQTRLTVIFLPLYRVFLNLCKEYLSFGRNAKHWSYSSKRTEPAV